MAACCQALRARPVRAARWVTVAPAIRWVAARSGMRPRRCGDRDSDVALQGAVSSGVVWGVVAPALPHDAAPGAAEGADRAGVFVAALAGLGVEVLGPGVPVAAAVRQPAERDAEAFVARAAEAGGFPFAGFIRDGGLG